MRYLSNASPQEVQEIAKSLSAVFLSYPVKRAVLFGSYAKGQAVQNSDVDVLVDSGLTGLRFVGLIEDIRQAVDREVDVLDVSHIKMDSRIAREIENTGILIYEK